MMNSDKRLIFSVGLCGVLAIYCSEASDRSAFVITDTAPAEDAPAEAAPPAQPAEIVCTFRCAACRRAPTLTYLDGDTLPAFATCKQCGRSMPRTDPKLSDVERQALPIPQTAQQSRRVFRMSCST